MRRRLRGEKRTEDQIREHYEIEVTLAKTLMNSTVEDRISCGLYTKVYDDLFNRVPHHQMLTKKASTADKARAIRWQMGLFRRFIRKEHTVLEIGPGDCSFSFQVCEFVHSVIGVDVSNIITDANAVPKNFTLVISDGCHIPLPDRCVDVVYSNQLMEHIHPDDATVQLQEIYRVLSDGGNYVCLTPNKVNGPWDISYYFDDVASGFHLKEYTTSELIKLFKRIGFRKCRTYVGARGTDIRFPVSLIILTEKLISPLPSKLRIAIGKSVLFRMILGIKMVATK